MTTLGHKIPRRIPALCAVLAVLANFAGATAAGEDENLPPPWPESRSPESFDAVIGKIFAGDPGGDGWGVLDMAPVVSFPALNEAEIKRLFSGNSIVSQDQESFLSFQADGAVTGAIEEERHITGTWRVENGLVCMDFDNSRYKLGCNYAALIIDRVVFFRANGKARFNGLIRQGKVKG